MAESTNSTAPKAAVAADPTSTSTAAITTTATPPTAGNAVANSPKAARPRQRKPSIHQMYSLPAPIRTFPLPAFHPTNPLSLIHVAYVWVTQTISPPVEPSMVYDGVWYPETRSVHVTDEKSMRGLWEQGFYGKGNFSRSEPHWLDRQKAREGLTNKVSSENVTAQRRQERQKTKWERARTQHEAIEQIRREEAERLAVSKTKPKAAADGALGYSVSKPPVGPKELLMLPNSPADLSLYRTPETSTDSHCVRENGSARKPASGGTREHSPENGNGAANVAAKGVLPINGQPPEANGALPHNDVLKMPPAGPVSDSGSDESKTLKRRKSVRFSPTVESTTFKLSDPPNPNAVVPSIWTRALAGTSEWVWSLLHSKQSPSPVGKVSHKLAEIDNKEHLQLTPEEAFFLAFAFGALRILDPSTKEAMPLVRVFALFRQHSYFPPRVSEPAGLRSDDPFLLHYVVYHHFRSIGWCVRPGTKFGVDWLLYLRGPVFNHAEFGVLVLPSYSDQWWKDAGVQAPQRSWSWLSGIARTLSQVYKSLVLVYVDIPPPPVFEVALEKDGFSGAFGRYKVREIMVGRWLHNRNRSVAPKAEAKGKGK